MKGISDAEVIDLDKKSRDFSKSKESEEKINNYIKGMNELHLNDK